MRLAAAIALAIVPTFTALSQNQYAILSHEGSTKVFSGSDALIEALGEAAEGDAITLSAGSFKAPFLQRPVTIRGAGMGFDGKGTYLTASEANDDGLNQYGITVQTPSDHGRVVLEGLVIPAYGVRVMSGNEVDVVNCRTMIKFAGNTNPVSSFRIIQCMVNGDVETVQGTPKPALVSSVVEGTVRNVNADHCVIKEGAEDSDITNSVLCKNGWHNASSVSRTVIVTHYPSGDDYYEKYYQGDLTDLNAKFPGNILLHSDEEVFKDGSEIYELASGRAEEWIGNDATQIGIHGGSIPFNILPSTPRITRFEVADKTAPDGTLGISVSIE